jgi:chaperone LolA
MSWLAFALLLLLPAQRPGVEELIDRVSATYGRMNNFQADFEQTYQDFSNQTSRVRGHVFLKSGRRARFDYTYPEEKSEYFEGKTYTKYIPAPIYQVTRRPISKAKDELLEIFQLVGNRESPWKDQFREKHLLPSRPVVEGDSVVRLIPKNKDLQEVLMEIDPRTFFIHRLVIKDADGQSNEFTFSNIKTEPLPESLFKFEPPPGVKVDIREEK